MAIVRSYNRLSPAEVYECGARVAVAMFTRLLLKLAGPVPSLKKRAAVRRC